MVSRSRSAAGRGEVTGKIGDRAWSAGGPGTSVSPGSSPPRRSRSAGADSDVGVTPKIGNIHQLERSREVRGTKGGAGVQVGPRVRDRAISRNDKVPDLFANAPPAPAPRMTPRPKASAPVPGDKARAAFRFDAQTTPSDDGASTKSTAASDGRSSSTSRPSHIRLGEDPGVTKPTRDKDNWHEIRPEGTPIGFKKEKEVTGKPFDQFWPGQGQDSSGSDPSQFAEGKALRKITPADKNKRIVKNSLENRPRWKSMSSESFLSLQNHSATVDDVPKTVSLTNQLNTSVGTTAANVIMGSGLMVVMVILFFIVILTRIVRKVSKLDFGAFFSDKTSNTSKVKKNSSSAKNLKQVNDNDVNYGSTDYDSSDNHTNTTVKTDNLGEYVDLEEGINV